MSLPTQDHRSIDTYSVAVIEGVESFDALMEAFGRVEATHRRKGRCFVTLDDLSQCVYTSGHARSKYRLGADVEYPEEDSRELVAAYDAARFQAAVAALGDPARTVSWESLRESAAMADGAANTLVALNRNPSLVVDGRHIVQCLPTDNGADLLADIPNGYFLGRELYGDQDSPAWTALAPTLYTSPVLLLGYAEDFTELTSEDDG